MSGWREEERGSREVRAGLFFALALVALACGDEAPTVDRSPATAPASTRFELRVIGGDRTLRELGEHAGPAARPFLVASVRDLVEGVIALPGPVRERVRGEGEARVLATADDDGIELAFAVPFDASGFDALEPGGPRGSARPGGAANLAVVPATADSPALLIAASSADHLATTLPYLAFGSFPPAPEGLHARFPDRRFADELRPWLERTVDELVGRGRASIAAERARHDRAPELGDPEVVLDRLAALGAHLGAWVADLGETTLSLTTDAAGAHLQVRSALASSPLSDALDASPPFALDAARIPEGTALALALPDAWLAPHALALAGDRIDGPARAQLETFASRWPEGPRTIALGASPARFVAVAAHAPNEARSEASGAAETANEPSPNDAQTRRAPNESAATREPPADWTTLPFARVWADALGTCDGGCVFEATHQTLSLGTVPTRTLADAPDAARALRGDVQLALVVDGARAATWLDPSHTLEPPAIAVLRVTREPGALVLALDTTPDALPSLVALATSFVD